MVTPEKVLTTEEMLEFFANVAFVAAESHTYPQSVIDKTMPLGVSVVEAAQEISLKVNAAEDN